MSSVVDSIYSEHLLKECIFLSPYEINNKFEDIILKKLKGEIEGKCIGVGYVMPDTIEILGRSLGKINNADFKSTTVFIVNYKARICNPGIGAVVKCYIGSIDKSQIVCYFDNNPSPIEIYLYKNHHVGNTDFIKLKINDKIKVKILASKFNYGDTQIIAIGQYLE